MTDDVIIIAALVIVGGLIAAVVLAELWLTWEAWRDEHDDRSHGR